MVILSLFQWWYSAGWMSALKHAEKRIFDAYRLFAIPVLLRTLGSPWRRIVSRPGPGIDGVMRSIIDNTVSRVVGFLVRSIVLLTAGLVISAASIVSILELILWFFVPPAVIALLVLGVIA